MHDISGHSTPSLTSSFNKLSCKTTLNHPVVIVTLQDVNDSIVIFHVSQRPEEIEHNKGNPASYLTSVRNEASFQLDFPAILSYSPWQIRGIKPTSS